MAPFRGRGGTRGGRSRGGGGARGRGGGRGGGGGRGDGRGGAQSSGKLARSGIKTKNGYRKFDSQRVKDVDDSEDEQPPIQEEESEGDDEEVEEVKPAVKAYSTLLQSFHQPADNGERKAKRRKFEHVVGDPDADEDANDSPGTMSEEDLSQAEDDDEAEEADSEVGDVEDESDPFDVHFANSEDNELSIRLKAIQANNWETEKQILGKHTNVTASIPSGFKELGTRKTKVNSTAELPLKERLVRNVKGKITFGNDVDQTVAASMINYQDLLLGHRNVRNAGAFRSISALHVVNHVLKGRDKVLKHNDRLKHADGADSLSLQDQGFVRPKVLILTETRQMAANYANSIVKAFGPDQEENRKRFDDSFTGPLDDRETLPDDYRELFGGNNDNSFLAALKFTRKTLKFYSAFYNSDVILASPLGLRRIIENEDVKKRDHDFLSSIEIVIADQADAMYMQNWENVEVVFDHLNLQVKEMRGADISRIRSWYLDGNAKYLRQTIVFSAYIAPEMNRLYNNQMQNIAGKVKVTSRYSGAITKTSGLGIKQTFSRFDSPAPASDPDARFKYFTTAILPRLLRLPKPANGAQGILVFIPSYFDFLRLRNFFATSTQTENISFGTIHDYSEVSDQRRARSHFSNGRHSILLYTQRAHHFFRLKIKGVKRVVMYGLPDNPIFYQELVEGFIGTSINEGKIDHVEASVRTAFSKWDGLRLERVVGSERMKGMLGGAGDTFDFV